MAFHDDLLQQALELAGKNPDDPKQADLRRSVSAAYYALFHLLISETTVHWRLDSSRDGLARMFEHRVMAKASARIADPKLSPLPGENPMVVEKLRLVATAFVVSQESRHLADYDNTIVWGQSEALEEVKAVAQAFRDWQTIREETIAQDFLVSLLIRPRN